MLLWQNLRTVYLTSSEWVAVLSSKGSSQPGIEPASLMSPELAGGFFTTSTIREALLIVSYIYLSQKCHLVGIIQYVEFSELKFMFQTFDSCTHLNLFTHLALHIDVSSVSFHVLVLSFLLLPDNIPLDWCFTVY